MLIKVIIETLRPEQWYKNLLIYIPLVVSLHLFNLQSVLLVTSGFAVLCLSSASSYVINDLTDYKKDVIHSEKSKRPIASGRLSKKHAIKILASLIIVSEISAYFFGISFLLVNSLLIILGFIYSLKARELLAADVLLISLNYVLRAAGGSFVLGQKVTFALIVGMFFLAMLLALGKRRNEISYLKDRALEHRKVLEKYSQKALDYSIIFTSVLVMISYSIYSIKGPEDIGDWRLVLTIPIGFLIIFLYVKKIIKDGLNGRELNYLLANDKKMIVSVISFIVLAIVLLYSMPPHYFK
jgi:4-hydroxybenzoate polyprenyltransferase